MAGNQYYKESDEQVVARFWKYVNKTSEDDDECWLWTKSLVNGYGWFTPHHTGLTAHRFSYLVSIGPIPTGLYVCHRCNNKPCVRPSHLYAASPKVNTEDAVKDGLLVGNNQGSTHGMAKLDEEKVKIIRMLGKNGQSHGEIAKQFNVSRRAISTIISRDGWKHVE